MNRLTPEALDALLADHVVCPNPECPFLNQEHCPACGPLVPWPCTYVLLASEVRDARPVIEAARITAKWAAGLSYIHVDEIDEALAHYEEGTK